MDGQTDRHNHRLTDHVGLAQARPNYVKILVTCRAWCGASLSCRMCGNLTTWVFFTVISEGNVNISYERRGGEIKM